MNEPKMLADPMAFLDQVIRNAEKNNPREPEDYVDSEGLLICGKCHTRRQAKIKVPDFYGGNAEIVRLVMIPCKCRKEAMDQDERRRKADEEQIRTDRLRSNSMMDERFRAATFKNARVTDSNRDNLKLLYNYAKNFDSMVEKNQGLMLHGDVGTGKSYGAACIANYLLDKGISVVMTSFVKLIAMARDDSGLNDMAAQVNQAKLLIIDDLGAERDTSYALERVYDIIDSRYRQKLPLIITTNLGLNEMLAETDLRFRRTYDRLFEMCYPVKFKGQSWRKIEAGKRFDEMKKIMEEANGKNCN